jgi:hypothetical protein
MIETYIDRDIVWVIGRGVRRKMPKGGKIEIVWRGSAAEDDEKNLIPLLVTAVNVSTKSM